MQTVTIKHPSIGYVLSFNEGDYTFILLRAEKIKTSIESLKETYKSLGLKKPFTNDLYENLMSQGISFIRPEFEEVIKADFSTYKNPVTLKSTLADLDAYLLPYQDAVNKVKDALSKMNEYNNTSYKLSSNTFVIKDEEVFINETDIKENFTRRIETEAQLKVFNQLHQLEKVYNETVTLLNYMGAEIASGGLINTYLKRELDHDGLTKGHFLRVNNDYINNRNIKG